MPKVNAPASRNKGARNPNAVLTERLVREVHRLHSHGFGYGRIADHLDVTKSCVQKVLTGRTWSHLRLSAKARRPVTKVSAGKTSRRRDQKRARTP